MESFAVQTDHFPDAIVGQNVAYGYDVVVMLWCSKVNSRRHFA